jgi:hypothetical protein
VFIPQKGQGLSAGTLRPPKRWKQLLDYVLAGLDPAIHVFGPKAKTWITRHKAGQGDVELH